jgi:hypothetical protein
MRSISRSVVLALAGLLVIGGGPAAAATERDTVSGFIARATFISCDDSGCSETLVLLTDNTYTAGETVFGDDRGCIYRHPTPEPTPGTWYVALSACTNDATFASDLGSATANGGALIFAQECVAGDGCGVALPIDEVTLSVVFSATGDRERVNEVVRSNDVVDGKRCQTIVVTTGWSREAAVTVSGYPYDLGTLTSATISDVDQRTTTTCSR